MKIKLILIVTLLCVLVCQAAPGWKYGTIVVQASPTYGGTVSGGGRFHVNSIATLSAHANTNWIFLQWQDGTTNPTRTVVVPRGTTTYTANFRTNTPTVYGTIGLVAEPINGGTVAGSGTYVAGTVVTISATPSANFVFSRWQDGDQNASRSVTVPNAAVLYTATFVTNIVYGTVTGIGNPIQGGYVDVAPNSGSWVVGSTVTLTAVPNPSWRLISWNDSSTGNPRTVTVAAGNLTYTANFQNFGTIQMTSEPLNAGTVTGAGTYPVGTLVTLGAFPSSTNWLFSRWQDGNTNMQRQVTLISGIIQFTATFTTNSVPTPHSARLFWDKVTDPGVKGYKVYYGVAPHTYTNFVQTAQTNLTFTNLDWSSTYYFATTTAYSNVESAFSCEVWWKYPGSNACVTVQ